MIQRAPRVAYATARAIVDAVGDSAVRVFDLSDPKRPVVVGLLPTASTVGGEFWRDIKVYADHAFIVSEYDDHPMQVFD